MQELDNPFQSPLNGGAFPNADSATLLVSGIVNVEKDKGPGVLLFTRDHVFAFRERVNATMIGAATFGLLGALVGHLITKFRPPREPSAHLGDPEIAQLPEKQRKKLEKLYLLKKIPLSQSLEIERTLMGFNFKPDPATLIHYKGVIHKGKIEDFFISQGISVR